MLDLRNYQKDCIDQLRQGVVKGHRKQVLVAPTGAGKTVIATHLMFEAVSKGSVAWFMCDRVSLCDQTSQMLQKYGLDHGVIQANHWRYRPSENAQVVSAQTIAKRDYIRKPKLIIWDECHTIYKSVLNVIEANSGAVVVGLTATPFTKGMDKVFSNVVNSTTTQSLINQGWLVPIRGYVAKAIDVDGVEIKSNGEWEDQEIEKRSIQIVGDVVAEWEKKTFEHFEGPVKTICFSASVAHGEELCRAFAQRGYNFQQISYKDGNDKRRLDLINEFRRRDSIINGLVSCEALAKGFDVPDIMVGIGARPYRKSLSSHIQQIGRVMRSHPDKDYAVWLDHAGNLERFAEDQQQVFQFGITELSSGALDQKVRKERTKEEKEAMKCGGCGAFFLGRICPSCGWTRKTKKSDVIEVSGKMEAFSLPSKNVNNYEIWQQLCWIARERKQDEEKARAFAQAQYKNMFGSYSRWKYMETTPQIPTRETQRKVSEMLQAYRKKMRFQSDRDWRNTNQYFRGKY